LPDFKKILEKLPLLSPSGLSLLSGDLLLPLEPEALLPKDIRFPSIFILSYPSLSLLPSGLPIID
jgi:hypothetical protein